MSAAAETKDSRTSARFDCSSPGLLNRPRFAEESEFFDTLKAIFSKLSHFRLQGREERTTAPSVCIRNYERNVLYLDYENKLTRQRDGAFR